MAESLLIEREPEDLSLDDVALVRAAQLSLENFKPLYQKWLAPVYRYFHNRVGNAKDAVP